MPTLTVRRGQVWLLGRHRLMCGDATRAADVEQLVGRRHAKLMVTDPPYGVNYLPTWRKGWRPGFANRGRVANDDRCRWAAAWELFNGDVAYVWHASLHAAGLARDFHKLGFQLRSQIVWAKRRGVFSRGHYHWQHEPCFYFVRQGCNAGWAGDRRQTTIWPIAPEPDRVHSTQKPLDCMGRPIANHGQRGDWVYDPFAGAGTTLIAAHGLGRRCLAMEILPSNVRRIIDRWQALTGRRAVLSC